MKHQTIIPYSIITSISQCETQVETRLFGWVLAKAQAVQKLYQRDLGEINLAFALDMVRVTIPAAMLLNPGDNNYSQIPKAFRLARKTIHYERDGLTAELNIIANPRFVRERGRKYVTFIIDNELWLAMLDFTKGYRVISLDTYMRLRSSYSIILYLLISQQHDRLEYKLETLRAILGATSKAYDRTSNFIARVIEPVKEELTELAPFTFTYELERGGRGGGYKIIRITPHQNRNFTGWTDAEKERLRCIQKQRIRLDDRVTEYIEYNFGGSPVEIERLEPFLLAMGNPDAQLGALYRIKEATARRRVRNRMAYLTTSLKRA